MERLSEPQFQIRALTVHPQCLPDTPIVPSYVRAMCCRGSDKTGGDKGPEQHRNSGDEVPWWLWSWVVFQRRKTVIKEKKPNLACSLFLLFDMWFLRELPELQMAACDACLLWKRRKVRTDLPSFWSISAFTCSFLDKCTKKRKGQQENLAHVRMFKSDQNKISNIWVLPLCMRDWSAYLQQDF